MKTIDERIADANARLENAETDADKAKVQGELDVLTELKSEGLKTQADLNAVDQQNKEKLREWEQASGTNLEDFKKVMENIESSIAVPETEGGKEGDSGKPTEGDASPLLGRVSKQIEDERNARLQFERRLHETEIRNRIHDGLRSAGLNDRFFQPASQYTRNVVGFDDLVDKAMHGNEVSDDEIKQKADAVKTASDVWFESEPNPDYPGVPPSPEGGEAPRLTDEQRAERAANVF